MSLESLELLKILASTKKDDQKRNIERIQGLLNKGADIHYIARRPYLDLNITKGDTALLLAMKNKHTYYDLLEFVLNNSDPNALNVPNDQKDSAILLALKSGNPKIIHLFMEKIKILAEPKVQQDIQALSDIQNIDVLDFYTTFFYILNKKRFELLPAYKNIEAFSEILPEQEQILLAEIIKQLNDPENLAKPTIINELNTLLDQRLKLILSDLKSPQNQIFEGLLHLKEPINLLVFCIQQNRLELALILITDWFRFNRYNNREYNPFLDHRVMNEIYRSQHRDVLLKALENKMGTVDADKIDQVILKIDDRRNEQDFLKIFALPFSFSNKQTEQLFDLIDNNSPLIPFEKKQALKRTFQESQKYHKEFINKKSQQSFDFPTSLGRVETLWKELTAKNIAMRLFGNIHNDPNLQGSTIQGMDINNSLMFLCQFIRRIETFKMTIPGLSKQEQEKLAQNLLPMRDKLWECIKYQRTLSEFLNNSKTMGYENYKKEGDDMTEAVASDIIASLKKNKSVLFPGGWLGKNRKAGHAMLYELRLIDNKLVFLVHNMGAGIQYHAKRSLFDQEYYSSVQAFEVGISEVKILEETLPKLLTSIQELIKPNYLPGRDLMSSYNATQVYEIIKKFANENQMKLSMPYEYSKLWTKGQLSGTCAFRVFESYIDNFPFPNKLSTKELKYEILRTSLQDHYLANQDNLADGILQRQMNFALQNFSILLRELGQENPPLLSEERLQNGITLAQEIATALNKALPPTKQSLQSIQPESKNEREQPPSPSIMFETKLDNSFSYIHKETKTEKLNLQSDQMKTAPLSWMEISKEINENNILDNLTRCINVCEKNSTSGFHIRILHDIESLFNNIPLEDSIFKNLPRENLDSALETLLKLMTLYGKSIAALGGVPTAERQMAFMLGQIHTFNLFSEYYKDNQPMINAMASVIMRKNVNKYLQNVISPYFLTLNAAKRNKLNAIKTQLEMIQGLHSRNHYSGGTAQRNKTVFHHLLGVNELEKKELAQACDSVIASAIADYEPLLSQSQAKMLAKASDEEKAVFYALCFRQKVSENFLSTAKKIDNFMKFNDVADLTSLAQNGHLMSIQEYPPRKSYLSSGDVRVTQDNQGKVICEIREGTNIKYDTSTKTLLSKAHSPCSTQFKELLEYRSDSSNAIQTVAPSTASITSTLLSTQNSLFRTLRNIRLNPKTQVSQAVDFMKRQIFRLQDPEVQNYIYISLFEIPLLEKQFKQSSTILLDLVDIIKSGLGLYKHQDQIRPEGLFFLKLSVSLYNLLESMKNEVGVRYPESKSLNEALRQLHEINQQVENSIQYYEKQQYETKGNSAKESQNTSVTDILMQLHRFNILNLLQQRREKHEEKQKEQQKEQQGNLEKILSSMLYIQGHRSINFSDRFLNQRVDQILAENQEYFYENLRDISNISQNKAAIDNMLNRLMIKADIQPPKNSTWEIQYPWFYLKVKGQNIGAINGLTGRTMGGIMEKIPIPEEIAKSQLLVENIKNIPAFVTANPDRTIYEFEQDNLHYRFLDQSKHFNKKNALQCEITINGQKKWFQYCDSEVPIELPKILQDRRHKVWKSIECLPNESHELLVVDPTNGLPCYYFNGETISELDNNARPKGGQLFNANSLEKLLELLPGIGQFEDKKYILVTKSNLEKTSETEIIITLPRYSLSFKVIVDKTGKLGDLVWLQDPRYKINFNFYSNFSLNQSNELIPHFNTQILLVPIDDATLPPQVLIPDQMFLATDREENEYYQLELDVDNQIKSHMVQQNDGLSNINANQLDLWGSERYFKFTITQPESRLNPESNIERLFLVQLYMAKRQPLLAHEYLSLVLKSDKALSKDECERLRIIIEDTPAKLTGFASNLLETEKAVIETPEYTAARLLAYSILIKQKNLNLGYKPLLLPRDTLNDKYRLIRDKNLNDFLTDNILSAKILALLNDYYKKIKYVPARMGLNRTQEELELLRYVMRHNKDVPPHLKFQRRELELQKLVLERDRLISQKLTRQGQLLEAQQRRLDELSKRINNYTKVETHDLDIKGTQETIAVSVPMPSSKEVILPLPAGISSTHLMDLLQNEKEDFSKIYAVQPQQQLNNTESKKLSEHLLSAPKSKESALDILDHELQIEVQLGQSNNLKIQARNEASNAFFNKFLKKDNGVALSQKLSLYSIQLNAILNKKEADILTLANQEPSDAKKRGEWTLKKLSQQVGNLSIQEVFRLFLKRDQSLYQAKTALEYKEILELQQRVFEYLLIATEKAYHERLSDQLKILQSTSLQNIIQKRKSTPLEIEGAIQQIGMLLSMKRAYQPHEHPEILLFEHLDNKIIYPEQFKYLEELMRENNKGFDSKIIKLIMGGGKSKIIQPLLSLKKATGTNLVAMIVPEGLFEMSRADLNATTLKQFGIGAHSFHFDEHVRCTKDYLLSLKRKLKNIIINREYIVTTKESLQSLESKFLNLLRYGKLKDKETKIILRHLGDILRILRHQGDFLIDEVDSTLDVRKQLIHPTGKVRHLSKEIAQVGVDFFSFINSLSMPLDFKFKQIVSLAEIISRNKLPSVDQWENILDFLAFKVVTDQKSPLFVVLRKFIEVSDDSEDALDRQRKERKELILYLLGKSNTLPAFIQHLNPKEQNEAQILEMIAFYKLQLENSLPLKSLLYSTLSKKKFENYGPTKDLKTPEEVRELAIPYSASDTPNESSRFKNPIETLNYTLQMHYGLPLSRETIARMIRQFKLEHEEELKQGRSLGLQSAANRFLNLTKHHEKERLQEVELGNPESFNRFYNRYCQDEHVKQYCMVHHLLNHIEENEEYITNDAHNFCGIGRSIQGMTGTDWNKRCFPKYINTEQALAGSDGQVIDYLLSTAVKPHLVTERLQMLQSQEYVQSIQVALNLLAVHPMKTKFHAWIDLGAHFRGIANSAVAKHFCDFFNKNHSFSHLRYVLYFEGDGKLYAMSTTGGTKILLEETRAEYIQSKLGVPPEQYFVYFDQRRTTGTDIKLSHDARAFLTLGAATLKRDLLQAAMRMRELHSQQRVELVIPKECQDVHPDIHDWTVKSVIDMCQQNESNRLMEDHFRAVQQEMRQCVRNDLMEKILKSHDIKQQKKYIKYFHETFFNRLPSSLFEIYGGIPKEEAVAESLNTLKNTLIDRWQDMLKIAQLEPTAQEVKSFSENMTAIIKAILPYCRKQIIRTQNEGEAQNFGTEVQVETLQTAEIESQEEQEQELNYRLSSGAKPIEQKFLREIPDILAERKKFLRLQSMAFGPTAPTKSGQVRNPKPLFDFSQNIFVTESFARTLTSQKEWMNAYTKDNVFFMVEATPAMSLDEPEYKFNFLLLTPEEAGHLGDKIDALKKSPNLFNTKRYWIETTHNTLHAGDKPYSLNLKEYRESIEQIAFFNGDLDITYRDLKPDSWIMTKPREKLQFFERVIQPLHQDKVNLLNPLRAEVENLIQKLAAMGDSNLPAEKSAKPILMLRETKRDMGADSSADIAQPSSEIPPKTSADTIKATPTHDISKPAPTQNKS